MKKFTLFVALVALFTLVSCQKDSAPSGMSYTIEIAANKYADAIATDHVVFEHDASGHVVGRHLIENTEAGVRKVFSASREAVYLTVRMDLASKGSSGKTRSYYYSYMFILEDGKANMVSLTGASPVQETEPIMPND